MKREIKFRAWVDPEPILGLSGEMKYFDLHDRNWSLTDGSCPVMQYTGLRDKNGVEIYEGDIVKADGQIMRVVWFSLGACFRYAPDDENLESVLNYDDIEVIGNIYENSDLLK